MQEKPANADKQRSPMSIGICKVDGSAEAFASGAGINYAKANRADRERKARAPDPKAGASDWKGLPPGDYLKSDKQLEAERKAKVLEPLSQVGGVQDPVIGAAGGIVLAAELGATKTAQLAGKVWAFLKLASVESEDDPRFVGAVMGAVSSIGGNKESQDGQPKKTGGDANVRPSGTSSGAASATVDVGASSGSALGKSGPSDAARVDRKSILQELRRRGTAEASASAKLISKGKVNLKLEATDPTGQGRAGLQPFGSKDVVVYLDTATTPHAAASVAAHEVRHWLQGPLSPSTYNLGHEIDAYRWQSRAFGYGWTDARIDQIIKDNMRLYGDVPRAK
jgi:hypothetical protein